MAPPKKTVADYEAEATWIGECLVHPAANSKARVIYERRHGILPFGMDLCHRCDNPPCINDNHHFVGTRSDNIKDSVKKGRHSSLRKGGVRFTGHHTDEAKALIGEATRKMWETRRLKPISDKARMNISRAAKLREERKRAQNT